MTRDAEHSDYLWDRSGEPDAAVQRLEAALGGLRYERPAPALPAPRRGAALGIGAAAVGLAAAAALVAAGLGFSGPAGAAWPVHRAGSATASGHLGVGEWLETGAGDEARLVVPALGRVDLGPESRVRLVASRDAERRLELARGHLEAHIVAPPRRFYVETPTATAVDLGCSYRLEVDAAGRSALEVTAGWVALERAGRSSLVPRGARCTTGADGPGTPAFTDAPARLREALARFDRGEAAALGAVLAGARPRDTLTLWHLLRRTEGAARRRVYERLVALAGDPPTARERVLDLDGAALEAWRRALYPTWY